MQKNEKDKKRISNVIETSLENLRNLVDVDTVMGTPIKGENGELVIPFSKVSFGVVSGGGEYGKVNIFNKSGDLPYTAGNGSFVSVKPCGFLIKDNQESLIKVVTIGSTSYERILEKASDIISSMKVEN